MLSKAMKAQSQAPTDEVRESQVPVGHNTLDLVELRQVRRVHGLIAEDAVDTEELRGPEAIPLAGLLALARRTRVRSQSIDFLVVLLSSTPGGELVQHRSGVRRGVRAQKELAGLLV